MTRDELCESYLKDGDTAANGGVQIPAPPSGSNLRTCRWNVHYFVPTNEELDYNTNKQALAITKQLLETTVDVIVLNEFGIDAPKLWTRSIRNKKKSINICWDLLEQHGYTLHLSPCSFPTAVATKRKVCGTISKLHLDLERAAVAVPIQPAGGGPLLWTYGTHLEASDSGNGKERWLEMETLLSRVEKMWKRTTKQEDTAPRIMIVGDLNQQRRVDYTKEEWDKIGDSKRRRDAPLDDGSTMLAETGFHCVF